MSFITLKNINKSFNGEPVLKDINLTIEEGSTLGILGRSGSGKSVLINMLRGTKEYAPDSGEVLFDLSICENKKCLHVEPASKAGEKCPECGDELKSQQIDFWKAGRLEKAAIRRRISIMLQRNFALYDEQTVIDNVLNAMGDEGRYEEENIYRAIDLLEMVQMSHRVTHVARDLSGGEKQRVVLARQLAKNPMLLLADEPTGTLDPQTAEKLHQTLIHGVKDEGISMVITSHWPEVMSHLADDVIWLDEGEIIEHGDPNEIVEKFLETVPQAEQVERVEHTEEAIKVDEIKKHYYSIERGVVKAVDGVSLTINKGEIYGIVGLSGSGKTTLTRMIIGLTEPSSGELEIRLGDDWIDMKKPGPLNRGRVTSYLGLLHQEYSLYPHRDVLGNLTDAISLNLPAEFAKIKAAHILETVGFEKDKSISMLAKWPDELSGGERHRVALAQVLIKEPNIVVLDEPTGTMDPVTRIIVTNSILKARDELDQTFVIISHDMDFVLDVCDKASLMRGGKLLKTGTPEEIVVELTGEEKEDMLKDH
ncbi:methyl coenzyme M reductase system, component A2 [Methanobrevibacter olleyae]|uniref:Methyl coenzyme M reductase system, component A2 n=1 Tax=Methanobrevibacter olleyae TaxID=294671 RepID=A0A126R1B5_METOL|nr:methyl coenzyme M reductase system, component A2 [Methanobrevibacter olleyae]AMK15862.1 methyl-coenzyme M reductase component A2 AtwA [Methanobrevibacter olleyae]SFL20872.1 methyl coenzyme M reductase system, component A2 [Methanobrevibacter olleyae]